MTEKLTHALLSLRDRYHHLSESTASDVNADLEKLRKLASDPLVLGLLPDSQQKLIKQICEQTLEDNDTCQKKNNDLDSDSSIYSCNDNNYEEDYSMEEEVFPSDDDLVSINDEDMMMSTKSKKITEPAIVEALKNNDLQPKDLLQNSDKKPRRRKSSRLLNYDDPCIREIQTFLFQQKIERMKTTKDFSFRIDSFSFYEIFRIWMRTHQEQQQNNSSRKMTTQKKEAATTLVVPTLRRFSKIVRKLCNAREIFNLCGFIELSFSLFDFHFVK